MAETGGVYAAPPQHVCPNLFCLGGRLVGGPYAAREICKGRRAVEIEIDMPRAADCWGGVTARQAEA